MRVSDLTLLVAICLGLAGCGHGTLNSPETGAPGKLQDAIVGKWAGTEGKNEITREFSKDGAYAFESGKVKYTGKWKALDDDKVEISCTLTKDQVEAAMPIWKESTEIADKFKLPFEGAPERLKEPEPKEGENKAVFRANVNGDVLTWGAFLYRRSK
jgi:hypothetical protein